VDAVVDGIQPVALHHVEEAAGAQVAGGDLGAHVAKYGLRRADVHRDQARQLVVQLAALEQLHRRDLDALLPDLGGVRVPAARVTAADVDPVRANRREGDDAASPGDGQGDHDVVQVLAENGRVVGGEDVAGLDAFQTVDFDDVLDGVAEVAEEDRQAAER